MRPQAKAHPAFAPNPDRISGSGQDTVNLVDPDGISSGAEGIALRFLFARTDHQEVRMPSGEQHDFKGFLVIAEKSLGSGASGVDWR